MTFFSPSQLHSWLIALKAGEVVAAPAEGMYGYCADPFNQQAIQTLLKLKQRSAHKGLIILIPEQEHLRHLCPMPLPPECETAISRNWPCPEDAAITLILPARLDLSPALTGQFGTLAVRQPATPYMEEYLQAWAKEGRGALISTSLNLSGDPPATSSDQIPPDTLALTLPHALSGKPSAIYNPQTGQWLR